MLFLGGEKRHYGISGVIRIGMTQKHFESEFNTVEILALIARRDDPNISHAIFPKN